VFGYTSKIRTWTIAKRAILLVIVGVMLIPVVWLFMSSFLAEKDIWSSPPKFFPTYLNFSNYEQILSDSDFAKCFKNSLIIVVPTTVLVALVAVLGGYASARSRFKIPFLNLISIGILGAQMVPGPIILIPLFILYKFLNIIGTYVGIVFSYVAFLLPVALWLMRTYLLAFPEEIEDAAKIDGCSNLQILTKVVLPNVIPGLITILLYTFIEVWGEYTFAVVLTDADTITLPIKIASFRSRQTAVIGPSFAGAVLFSLPVIIIALMLHRYISTSLGGRISKG